MNNTLLQSMHEGALVITPNNRLASHLIKNYESRYRSTQSGPLAKPLCFSYETWLIHQFNHITQNYAHDKHPCLLSRHQLRYAWEMVLLTHHDATLSTEFIDDIQEAWQRCIAWDITPDHADLHQATHIRRFQHWYQTFQEMLHSRNALSTELIPRYLIDTNYPIQATAMIWVCFDEFTPIQLRLQKKLYTEHCPQQFHDYPAKQIQGYCLPAIDQKDELQQAILWAKERLEQGDQHIAIIIPELEKHARIVHHTFAQSFAEQAFNISYGKRLLDYPIIATALHWLALDLENCSAHDIRMLLQAPFLQGGQTEFTVRSQILQDHLMMKAPQMTWQAFLEQIATLTPYLHTCLQTLQPYPPHASPFAWIMHFKARLRHIGFPGEAAIDSMSHQCLNRFYVLLDEFMSLHFLTKTMTAQDALQTLRHLSANTIFQIQKPATPITVLGILEASGCQFDSIWITGLTDQCLPQKTKFSPLLPIALQKKMLMPYTDANREYQRAQQLLHRFGYASQRIVYSYPQTCADQPQLPTVLIQHYPIYQAKTQNVRTWQSVLENYQEPYRHPHNPEARLSGGTALLANQAKCPFQAFARHRLKIKTMPMYTDGLDLAERGQILHNVMEIMWNQLRQQSTLIQLSSDRLEELVQSSIHTVLQTFMTQRPASLSPLSLEVEYQRLTDLVHSCLIWEKQRAPFQVEALEQTYDILLAGLPLQVRVDRLDRNLLQADKTVIDYKTSLPTNKPWLEERPEAPQVLLYALLDPDITTLLFIQLKAGKTTVQGLSATDQNIPGIQALRIDETWSSYRQHWETQLTQLAEEITQGHCKPNPKRTSVCQQCDFQSLCRLPF